MKRYVLLLLAVLVPTTFAMAIPITITYTVSGSAGNWILDFTVQNNISSPAGMDVYYFVPDATGTVAGTPAGFFNYGDFGWMDIDYGHLLPGSSQSGFLYLLTDEVAPTSIDIWTWAYGGGDYLGGDNLNSPDGNWNPNWVVTATQQSAVPEPGSLMLIASGLASIAAFLRRQR